MVSNALETVFNRRFSFFSDVVTHVIAFEGTASTRGLQTKDSVACRPDNSFGGSLADHTTKGLEAGELQVGAHENDC
ncbi:hypothetical protein M758_6G201400 [Ceratodon purpureus]|nr:hypothetical protein M758_6G201400 [Ceratodon purpureus]